MLVKSLISARFDKGRVVPGSTSVGSLLAGYLKVCKLVMMDSVYVMLVSRS